MSSAIQEFRDGVSAIVATGISRQKAVSQFVAQNPKAHQALLAETSVRKPEASRQVEPAPAGQQYVQEYRNAVAVMVAGGMNRAAACSRWLKDNPAIHEALVAR